MIGIAPWTGRSVSVPHFAEDQRGVDSAEAERVVQGDVDGLVAADIGDYIEVAGRVGGLIIERRRDMAALDRQRAEDRFDRARGAERMGGEGLGSADGEPAGVL